MLHQREFDVSPLAQDVVDAWGTVMQGGKGDALSADFKALFEKASAYRSAKRIADNHREHNKLTKEEAEQEQRTRNEFLDAYLPVCQNSPEMVLRAFVSNRARNPENDSREGKFGNGCALWNSYIDRRSTRLMDAKNKATFQNSNRRSEDRTG